jgi:hypothetical protein
VKDVPAVRAEIVNPPTSVATVELQVIPSFVPRVSSVMTKIWLLAVMAEVFTWIELETAFVGNATLPAALDPHTAGEALEEQFVVVEYAGACQVFEDVTAFVRVPAVAGAVNVALPLVDPVRAKIPLLVPANPMVNVGAENVICVFVVGAPPAPPPNTTPPEASNALEVSAVVLEK